jgi:hypothetical protein
MSRGKHSEAEIVHVQPAELRLPSVNDWGVEAVGSGANGCGRGARIGSEQAHHERVSSGLAG